ncbi:MAG: DUF4923 family protein [Prevotella sp.]|nr:DUF4923 family protein [Candidatus Prevotella equi]
MKKLFFILAAMMLTANVANAQLSNVLNQVASKVQSSTTNGNGVLSNLGSIITSKLIPTSTQIVGTWVYQEPAVMFTSSNALKSAASSLATKGIETKLQSYLSKVGINKGKMSFTFNSDKTFYVNYGTKKVASGTYVLNGSEVTLTFKGRKNPCKVTPQLNNGSLVIVMDATKLKTLMENLGNNVSQLSTVTSLLKQVDGMKLGIRMTKQ